LVQWEGKIAGKLKLQPRNFINNKENNKSCSKLHVPFAQEHQESLIHPTGVIRILTGGVSEPDPVTMATSRQLESKVSSVDIYFFASDRR
jgi:hypothetical protein